MYVNIYVCVCVCERERGTLPLYMYVSMYSSTWSEPGNLSHRALFSNSNLKNSNLKFKKI